MPRHAPIQQRLAPHDVGSNELTYGFLAAGGGNHSHPALESYVMPGAVPRNGVR
jgi:hypothetical protein